MFKMEQLYTVLIKSIQEQNELIVNQQDASAKQEATIADLQKQLADLAAAIQTLTEK